MFFLATTANLPFLNISFPKCLILLFILFLITAFLDIFFDTTGDICKVSEGR
jgi:hypothetical protein